VKPEARLLRHPESFVMEKAILGTGWNLPVVGKVG